MKSTEALFTEPSTNSEANSSLPSQNSDTLEKIPRQNSGLCYTLWFDLIRSISDAQFSKGKQSKVAILEIEPEQG